MSLPKPQMDNVCNQCEKKFKVKSSLESHINAIHKKIFINCQKCDYKAACQSSLNYHNRSRHSNKRFPCDECDYQAIQNGELKKHKDSIHRELKYPCQQCNYVVVDPDKVPLEKANVAFMIVSTICKSALYLPGAKDLFVRQNLSHNLA